jgi:pyruvate dehydrogenase E2 component (dihydrolipoamide acetyltransferase)
MDAALALRAQINEALKAEGVKVSVNDMVIRAVALALRRFPNMNASFTQEGIEPHAHVHVGCAVTVPDGLVTVTVRDADTKTLKQISKEMNALAERARQNKMQPGDTGGQTFTISNLGMYEVDKLPGHRESARRRHSGRGHGQTSPRRARWSNRRPHHDEYDALR